MKTAHELLDRIDEHFPEAVERAYGYPFLRLRVTSADFTDLEPDDREVVFAAKLAVSSEALQEVTSRTFIRIELLSPGEVGPPLSSLGASWVALLDRVRSGEPPRVVPAGPRQTFIHFYGFKGGQGRSTALALLAHALAADGYAVLAVDFDAEAPSLDVVFGCRATTLASTVLGTRCGAGFQPLALGQTVRGGEVHVLPFRPADPSYDIDAAALAFELQVYAPSAVRIAEDLATVASRFDVVLIDHRTGLGAAVPSLTERLPGPVVVCARLDRQSEHARSVVAGLWAGGGDPPGVLLSLAPPDVTEDAFRRDAATEAEGLLQALADATGPATGDDEPREWTEFRDHWVVWPFDRQLATRGLDAGQPTPEGRSATAIAQVRRLLGLERAKRVQSRPSGARDEGDLIVTRALRALRSPDSPYTLIVGRKGTGKTRLVRELAQAALGVPLLVPTDFERKLGGIRAANADLKALIGKYAQHPEDFWFALIAAGLASDDGDEASLIAHAKTAAATGDPLTHLRGLAATRTGPRRVLLIDALETAFAADATFPFVQGLFRVLETLDATPDLSAAVLLRLFVRRDLVEQGIQNREQFEDGRRIDLAWDAQTILNFVLTRMASHDWYRATAPALVAKIDARLPVLREGGVPESDCDQLLLELFPERISTKNIKTTTFLRTYFSDDGRGESSFYPRVYIFFLEELTRLHTSTPLTDGRLDGTIIVRAHEAASQSFLEEVSQELGHAVQAPMHAIKAILTALDGETTPFSPQQLSERVADKANLAVKNVRAIFEVMKRLGVFEDAPKRLNAWRAGRLFKTGLRMRFAAGAG